MEHLWEEDDVASETVPAGYDDTFDQELVHSRLDKKRDESHFPGGEWV